MDWISGFDWDRISKWQFGKGPTFLKIIFSEFGSLFSVNSQMEKTEKREVERVYKKTAFGAHFG